ncbi:VRR-NUC domain-containing protein [Streptomyces uncialis]|uniref:VRR-NUC domain-containing protein n=1 Tax=Streptomyces uncialis TaxID=1048205 RepID=UPI00386B8E2C
MGPTQVKENLRFLADDYWGRYLGRPDLASWSEGARGVADVEFIEVKSSSDKLSEDQRDRIVNNHELLKLPFKIAKVHRGPKNGPGEDRGYGRVKYRSRS